MICANSAALARYDLDCAQADLDYKTAYGEGLQEAFDQHDNIKAIITLANQLSNKIREVQKTDRVWDYILDGVTNYEMENENPDREWSCWLDKYATRCADMNE